VSIPRKSFSLGNVRDEFDSSLTGGISLSAFRGVKKGVPDSGEIALGYFGGVSRIDSVEGLNSNTSTFLYNAAHGTMRQPDYDMVINQDFTLDDSGKFGTIAVWNNTEIVAMNTVDKRYIGRFAHRFSSFMPAPWRPIHKHQDGRDWIYMTNAPGTQVSADSGQRMATFRMGPPSYGWQRGTFFEFTGLTGVDNYTGAADPDSDYLLVVGQDSAIITSINVTNPEVPSVADTLTDSNIGIGILDVVIKGNRAYIAEVITNRFSKMHIVDVSNYNSLSKIATFTPDSSLRAIDARELVADPDSDVVYLGGWDTLLAVDVTNDSSKVVGTYKRADNQAVDIETMAINGNNLWMCYDNGYIECVDVSDQTSITSQSFTQFNEMTEVCNIQVFESGGEVFGYISTGDFGNGQIFVWDFTNPTKPELISQWGGNHIDCPGSLDLEVNDAGDTLFIGNYWDGGGITAYNISDRTSPYVVGYISGQYNDRECPMIDSDYIVAGGPKVAGTEDSGYGQWERTIALSMGNNNILWASGETSGNLTGFDVSDPSNMRPIYAYDLGAPERVPAINFGEDDQYADNIFVDRDHDILYATCFTTALKLYSYDVSDPANIVPLDSAIAWLDSQNERPDVRTPAVGGTPTFDRTGNYLLIPNLDGEVNGRSLYIYNVTRSTGEISLRGTWADSSVGATNKAKAEIAIDSDTAIITGGQDDIVSVLDISDVDNITVSSSLSFSDDSAINNPLGITISPNTKTAYVVNNVSDALTIFDYSTPSNLTLVSRVEDSATRAVMNGPVANPYLDSDNNSLWYNCSNWGLMGCIDITTKTKPRFLSHRGELEWDGNVGIAAYGDRVYTIGYFGRQLVIHRVTNSNTLTPYSPVSKLGCYSALSGQTTSQLVAIKDYVFAVGQDDHTVTAFDVSNPDRIKIASQIRSLPSLAYPWGMVTSGDNQHLFIGTGTWGTDSATYGPNFVTVDISDPYNMSIANVMTDSANFGQLSVLDRHGNYVYASDWGTGSAPATGGMHIIDVSNPLSPTRTGSITGDSDLRRSKGIVADSDYAYITGYWVDYLKVINVQNKSSPSVTGSITSGDLGGPEGIALSGTKNRVYIAARFTDGLITVDVSNKASPRIVKASTDSFWGNSARQVLLRGGRILLTAPFSDAMTIFKD